MSSKLGFLKLGDGVYSPSPCKQCNRVSKGVVASVLGMGGRNSWNCVVNKEKNSEGLKAAGHSGHPGKTAPGKEHRQLQVQMLCSRQAWSLIEQPRGRAGDRREWGRNGKGSLLRWPALSLRQKAVLAQT